MLLDPIQAIAALEAGLAIARTQGSVFWVGNITASLAEAYLLTGDLPRAAAVLEQAMSPEQAPRNLQERRMAWAWGELALAQHKPDRALHLADDCSRPLPARHRGQGGSPSRHS